LSAKSSTVLVWSSRRITTYTITVAIYRVIGAADISAHVAAVAIDRAARRGSFYVSIVSDWFTQRHT